MPELDVLNAEGVHTTNAQGEGGVEGVISNYSLGQPFDAHFAFSRFNANKGGARSKYRLAGTRRRANPRKVSEGSC